MIELAPIALFVYNRLDHTQQTVEALIKNKLARESELYIYSDAPANESEKTNVSYVRNYIKNIVGFKSIKIIEQEHNKGLASSIVLGVTDVVNKHGKIIVLEDDLVTAPNFLCYMNDALTKYEKENKVFSISGYSYCPQIEDNTYFLKLTTSWGWATWKNRWSTFEMVPEELEEYLKNKKKKYIFDYNNSYKFSNFLGWKTTWALYWYFASFKNDGLTLYPCNSLVQNIGFDGSGVHSTGHNDKAITPYEYKLTDIIQETSYNKNLLIKSFKSKNLLQRVKAKIPLGLKRLLSRSVSEIKLLKLNPRKIKNTYVDKSVHVLGWNNVEIGQGTAISEGCWLNVNHKKIKKIQISIGNYSYIGKRNFFSSGKEILIKDYFMSGVNCQFLGSDHVMDNPLKPYVSTGTTSNNKIEIGLNNWFGANVTVVGNVNIGRGSIIGACSLVTKDIPPFSLAVGSPAKVIKRFSFKDMAWIMADDYDSTLDRFMPSENEYLKLLQKTKVNIPFNAASKSFGDLL